VVCLDNDRKGFIATANHLFKESNYKYVVYTAEDAFPGMNWLKFAHEALETTSKSLLAFNDGKWFGRLAAFGMVRSAWAKTNYASGNLFFEGYKSHYADNELTDKANTAQQLCYTPNALLIEVDYQKGQRWTSNADDKALYSGRKAGKSPVEGLSLAQRVAQYVAEDLRFFNAHGTPRVKQEGGVSIIVPTLNGERLLKRLFDSFVRHNTVENYEIIVVDHNSTDATQSLCDAFFLSGKLKGCVLKRDKNYSFSNSCNLGAHKAAFSELLFLNNDVVVMSDFLPKMQTVLKSDSKIGAVGIKICGLGQSENGGPVGPVQHLGVGFKWNERRGYNQPFNLDDASFSKFRSSGAIEEHSIGDIFVARVPAVTAACMLVRADDFNSVGGFSENYVYGCEDVDLCLKLATSCQMSQRVVVTDFLGHNEMTTRSKISSRDRIRIFDGNHETLKRRWQEIRP
jgi:GT2 family glycosyltransferase